MEIEKKFAVLPAVALRGLTVFPGSLIHFDVGRKPSIQALEKAMADGAPVFLVPQIDLTVEAPVEQDLYQVGTISNVRQILRLPGNNVRVMVEGQSRARMVHLLKTEPHLVTEVEEIPAQPAGNNTAKTEALIRSTYELFQHYVEVGPQTSPDLLINILASDDPGYIADYVAQNIAMRNEDKQAILAELRPVRRLEKLHRLLAVDLHPVAEHVHGGERSHGSALPCDGH